MKPSIVPVPAASPAVQAGPIQALGRRALLALFSRLSDGQLRIVEDGGTRNFGRKTLRCPLAATIEVRHPQFWADAAFGGTVGAGESWIRGDWSCDDLTALIRIMVVNRGLMNAMDSGLAVVSAPLRRLLHWMNRNSPEGSSRQ